MNKDFGASMQVLTVLVRDIDFTERIGTILAALVDSIGRSVIILLNCACVRLFTFLFAFHILLSLSVLTLELP